MPKLSKTVVTLTLLFVTAILILNHADISAAPKNNGWGKKPGDKTETPKDKPGSEKKSDAEKLEDDQSNTLFKDEDSLPKELKTLLNKFRQDCKKCDEKFKSEEAKIRKKRAERREKFQKQLIQFMLKFENAARKKGKIALSRSASKALEKLNKYQYFNFYKPFKKIPQVLNAVKKRKKGFEAADQSYMKSYDRIYKKYLRDKAKLYRDFKRDLNKFYSKNLRKSSHKKQLKKVLANLESKLKADIKIPENAVAVYSFELGHFINKKISKKKTIRFLQDVSGNKNHGVCYKCNISVLRGIAGSATYCNGKVSCVELPLAPKLNSLNSDKYTIVACYRPSKKPHGKKSKDNNYNHAIVMRHGNKYEGLFFDKNSKFELRHCYSDKTRTILKSNKSYKSGYNIIVGTVDHKAGKMKLYVNGELVGRAKFSPSKKPMDYNYSNWYIGSAKPSSKTYRWTSHGSIDEVSLFDRVLTPLEIKTLTERFKDGRPMRGK